jgi:hypothetical protein
LGVGCERCLCTYGVLHLFVSAFIDTDKKAARRWILVPLVAS